MRSVGPYFDVDGEVVLLLLVHGDEALDDDGPLEGERRQEEVEADRRVAVPLQERHQEPEADEDHDVDILKHWRAPEMRHVTVLQGTEWELSREETVYQSWTTKCVLRRSIVPMCSVRHCTHNFLSRTGASGKYVRLTFPSPK